MTIQELQLSLRREDGLSFELKVVSFMRLVKKAQTDK
jgi:hypothetical protein